MTLIKVMTLFNSRKKHQKKKMKLQECKTDIKQTNTITPSPSHSSSNTNILDNLDPVPVLFIQNLIINNYGILKPFTPFGKQNEISNNDGFWK